MKFSFKNYIVYVYSLSLISAASQTDDTIFRKNNRPYLPIIEYQEALKKILSKNLHPFNYKKQYRKISTQTKNSSEKLSARKQALDNIKAVTSQLFDVQDKNHISVHLHTMKKFAEQLDPEEDKKTITAIHFLLENQHKSSYIHTLFWIKAIKEKDLHEAIPMTREVAQKTNVEKISIIRKKMLLPVKK